MTDQIEIPIPAPPSSFASSPEVVRLLKPYLESIPREQHERWMRPMPRAVARESKLDRVVFRPNPTRAEVFVGAYQVGSMDEDTGECTSSGPFAPLPDDDLATDWMLLCTEPKLLDD